MTKSTKLPILYHHVNSWQSKVTHEWADWGRQWCKNADFWLLSTKIYLLFSLTIRGARLLHLCVRFPVIEAYFACQSYFLQAIPCTFWSPPFLPSVSRLKIHVYRRVNCSRDLLSSIWCSKTTVITAALVLLPKLGTPLRENTQKWRTFYYHIHISSLFFSIAQRIFRNLTTNQVSCVLLDLGAIFLLLFVVLSQSLFIFRWILVRGFNLWTLDWTHVID